MSALMPDVRLAVRLLRRSPGFTTVAVIVLALAIGANTAVFSIVNAALLQPRLGRIDDVVGVFNRDLKEPDKYRDFSYPAYVDLRGRADLFEGVLAHAFTTVGVREGDVTRQTLATLVSSNYFNTLGVQLAAGRPFTLDEERPGSNARVAIAPYAAWRRAGFDRAFIGSSVRMNGASFTIVGVTPKGFAGTMAFVAPQWWLPLGAYDSIVNEMFKTSGARLGDRRAYALNIAGALKPGVTRAAAESALAAFAKALSDAYPDSDRDRTFVVGDLPRFGVSSRPEGDGSFSVIAGLLVLMSALVLAVACLNLANLLLARGVARRKEIAIRQALGSGRRRIVQQFLIEGLTVSLIGAAFGLLVGLWTTAALTAWMTSVFTLGIDVVVEPSRRVVVAAGGFAVLATVLFALGPAWSASRPDVARDLKAEPVMVRGRARIGSVLVVGQIAVSLALVAAGGLFTRGAINVASTDAGFPMERQIVIGTDAGLAGYTEPRTRAVYRAVLDRLRTVPGVERASFASTAPFGNLFLDASARTSPAERTAQPLFDMIGADYFATLGVRMTRGREFTVDEERSRAAVTPAIVDVGLARELFGDADPLGRTLQVRVRESDAFDTWTIVGVAPPLRHDLFDQTLNAHLYVPYGSRFNTMMTLHVRVADGASDAAMVATIRREIQQIDPQLPILTARTMTMQRDASISAWSVRAAAALFSAFGVLALLLAAIGVYGLRSYDVVRRTREIGIRMALGATSGDVQWLVLGESTSTTIAGLAIGLALALAIGKLASSMLFQVSPFDPAVLAVAAATLALAAVTASYVPARRATRVAPLAALRTE